MKNFYSFASSLALTSFASEDIGLWRWSDEDDNVIMASMDGTHTFVWNMKTKTGFEEDSGNEYFRITHELTGDVKATDQVTFEIAYQMKNDPWVNKMIMSEDGVICKVV